MKVMLTFPPQFDTTMPNLALPCLTAVLKNHNHEVIQKDLNVESFDTLLSETEIARASAKIESEYNSLLFMGADSQELKRLIKLSPFLLQNVEPAKQYIRDSRKFYNRRGYTMNQKILEDCLQLISSAYYGSRLTFESYRMYYSPFSVKQVLQAVKDPVFNLYYDFYTRYIIPEITTVAPRVLGISMATHNQWIPGLTLAYLVKQVLKDIHIVIGGNYVTILKDKLAENQALFSLFDSAIIYEGEAALPKLVDCLSADQALDQVPNLIYRDDSQIVTNKTQRLTDLNSFPAPSFETLPLHLYFAPFPVLPIYTSRGCYWGRCAFCNFVYSSGHEYITRDPALVKAEMAELTVKYDCRFFVFVDEAMAPEYLKQLSEAILTAGLKFNWVSFARFDKQFSRELCARLAQSGCRSLFFGLESACDRLLKLMNKGTELAIIREVLTSVHDAGIISQLFFFIGFPTENLAETKQTLKFVLDNAGYISGTFFENFNLVYGSDVYHHPVKYQIEKIQPAYGYDLILSYEYQVKHGLSMNESAETVNLFTQILAELGMPVLKNLYWVFTATHFQTNNLMWLNAASKEKLTGKKAFLKKRLRKARQKAAVLLKDRTFFEN